MILNCSISELTYHEAFFSLKFIFSKEYYFYYLLSLKCSEWFLLLLLPGLNCSNNKSLSPKYKAWYMYVCMYICIYTYIVFIINIFFSMHVTVLYSSFFSEKKNVNVNATFKQMWIAFTWALFILLWHFYIFIQLPILILVIILIIMIIFVITVVIIIIAIVTAIIIFSFSML